MSAVHQTGPLVRRFTRNHLGRDLIVGDVHGCFTKLRAALDAAGFDPARDRLFSVGDLVDRGPESDQALDWLALPWFFAVSGNHEDYAIRWPRGHMIAGAYVQNGGGWNVASPPEVSRLFADAFAALPVAMEIETAGGLVGVVHADVPCSDWGMFTARLAFGGGVASEAIDRAQWSRDRIAKGITTPVAGVRAVVVGHTPVPQPTRLGNVLFIDTAAWKGGNANPAPFVLLDAETLAPAALL